MPTTGNIIPKSAMRMAPAPAKLTSPLTTLSSPTARQRKARTTLAQTKATLAWTITTLGPTTTTQDDHSSSENNKPDHPFKLGKDGTLTQQEQQWKMDSNLCLFCSKGSHVAHKCPKLTSSSSKAKAWAAKTDKKSDTTLATDSKRNRQQSSLHKGRGLHWPSPCK